VKVKVKSAQLNLYFFALDEAMTKLRTLRWKTRTTNVGVSGRRLTNSNWQSVKQATRLNKSFVYRFDQIVPCGIADKGVTSLTRELQEEVDVEMAQKFLVDQFEKNFECDVVR
jgi:hypothetical protein